VAALDFPSSECWSRPRPVPCGVRSRSAIVVAGYFMKIARESTPRRAPRPLIAAKREINVMPGLEKLLESIE